MCTPTGHRQRSRGAALLCLLGWLALGLPLLSVAEGIEHIVIVWLKEPGKPEQRQRIVRESQVLREIPGVTGLRAGSMHPSERPVVDSSFDVALVISLRDAAALADYLVHPVHVQLVEETLRPLVAKIRVFDFSID